MEWPGAIQAICIDCKKPFLRNIWPVKRCDLCAMKWDMENPVKWTLERKPDDPEPPTVTWHNPNASSSRGEYEGYNSAEEEL